MQQKMSGLGHSMVYPVGPTDQSVSVRVSGTHRTYSMVVEGSSEGASGPWVKLDIFISLAGGRYEKHPGAFDVKTFNEERFFAVDTRFPVKLTHVRVRLQQWFGTDGTAITVTADGATWTPKAVSDTGGNQAFDELRGRVLAIIDGSAAADGHSEHANIGSDYRQLMFGVNVTAVEFNAPSDTPVVFSLQCEGADGVWYTVWSHEGFTAPGQFWVSIGAALHIDRMFSNVVRVAWVVPGVVRKVTYSASIMAKTLPS